MHAATIFRCACVSPLSLTFCLTGAFGWEEQPASHNHLIAYCISRLRQIENKSFNSKLAREQKKKHWTTERLLPYRWFVVICDTEWYTFGKWATCKAKSRSGNTRFSHIKKFPFFLCMVFFSSEIFQCQPREKNCVQKMERFNFNKWISVGLNGNGCVQAVFSSFKYRRVRTEFQWREFV